MSVAFLGLDPIGVEEVPDNNPHLSIREECVRSGIGLCIFALLICAFWFLILYKKID